MTDDRWQEVAEKIRGAFPDCEHTKESTLEGKGSVESFEFDGPNGTMKVERTKRPKILGERGIQSNRIGSDSTIEKIYSEKEVVDFINVYTWDDTLEDWVKLEDDSLLGAL